jgi:predicted dehydrogenase
MGGKGSMKGLVESGRYRLLGVADWSQEARNWVEQTYPGTRTFSSHGEMFQQCPSDVVCVSTWPPTHLEVTRDALERQLKGILVEKPLSDTHRDGAAILEAIRERNLPMVVPHGLLVLDHSLEIRDLVHGGAIGDLQLVEIQCRGWDIINAGIHWLNFIATLLKSDPAEFVMANCDTTSRTYRDSMQVETLGLTCVQTRSGLRVLMNTGDYTRISEPGEGVLFRLVGSAGVIEFYGWASRYKIMNAANPDGTTVEVESKGGASHQRHLTNLAEQIDNGEADYTVAESSLTALEWVEAAYISARHQCAVNLPLSEFTPPEAHDWDPGRPYSGEDGGRNGRKLPEEPNR